MSFTALPQNREPEVNPGASAKTLEFGPGADRLSMAYDVLLGYQIFLGRDPESSFVIHEKTGKPVFELVQDFVSCPEFQGRLARSLNEGTAAGRTDSTSELTREHIMWLQSVLSLSEKQSDLLNQATTWRELLEMLASELGGEPHTPSSGQSEHAVLAVLERMEAILQELRDDMAALLSLQKRARSLS